MNFYLEMISVQSKLIYRNCRLIFGFKTTKYLKTMFLTIFMTVLYKSF